MSDVVTCRQFHPTAEGGDYCGRPARWVLMLPDGTPDHFCKHHLREAVAFLRSIGVPASAFIVERFDQAVPHG